MTENQIKKGEVSFINRKTRNHERIYYTPEKIKWTLKKYGKVVST